MLLKRSFTGRLSLLACLAIGLLPTSPAIALGEITFAIPQTKSIPNAAANVERLGFCKGQVGSDQFFVSQMIPYSDAVFANDSELEKNWNNYLRREWGFRNGDYSECHLIYDQSDLREWQARSRLVDWGNSMRKAPVATADDKTEPQTASHSRQEQSNPAEERRQTAAELAAEKRRAHEAVEARNREAQAKYEAELAKQQRKVAEYERAKEDVARKKAAQQAEADAVLAKHKAEMEAHAQRLLEHQDAQRHHALCSVGDKAACDALAGGKLAEAAVPRDAGDASTDTDARQCVTEPVLSPNEAFKGSIKAVVVNGCAKPVDVRICLMRTGGWNCGMITALKPQDDWTWWTGDPQDGVFWDARTTGSTRQLGRPQG